MKGQQTLTKLAGTGSIGSTNSSAGNSSFNRPFHAVKNSLGESFIVDFGAYRIRKIGLNGQVSNFTGSGVSGYQNGPGLSAKFRRIYYLAVDSADNQYVTDFNDNRIRKITPAEVVSTLAGDGTFGNVNGQGTQARFARPCGICYYNGELYFTSRWNHSVCKVDLNGNISSVAVRPDTYVFQMRCKTENVGVSVLNGTVHVIK